MVTQPATVFYNRDSMEILWLSHLVPYPPKGGVLQRSYNLVKELCRYHRVTLVCFVQTDLLNAMFDSAQTGLREANDHLTQFCREVHFTPIPCDQTRYGKHLLALRSLFSRYPYTINWLRSREMERTLLEIKTGHSFDLIHFDTISLSPYLDLFADLPRVLDHHNIESHMMSRRSRQERNLLKKVYFGIEGWKLLRYEKNIGRKFRLHITCSELDSMRLARIDPSLRIEVIPNGVDIDYFYPVSYNEADRHLVFAGGLSWYPNADAMLFFAREIWPLLKNMEPDITMHVVGKSPPQELLDLSANDENFLVHGFVDDVREYISRAAVYVCPIRDGGGTRLKLLDAFAMGKATVAHPTACEGLAVTDNRNIMLARTPEEFATKIISLVRNPGLRKSLGANARANAVSNYSFAEIGKRLSDCYFEQFSHTTRENNA